MCLICKQFSTFLGYYCVVHTVFHTLSAALQFFLSFYLCRGAGSAHNLQRSWLKKQLLLAKMPAPQPACLPTSLFPLWQAAPHLLPLLLLLLPLGCADRRVARSTDAKLSPCHAHLQLARPLPGVDSARGYYMEYSIELESYSSPSLLSMSFNEPIKWCPLFFGYFNCFARILRIRRVLPACFFETVLENACCVLACE